MGSYFQRFSRHFWFFLPRSLFTSFPAVLGIVAISAISHIHQEQQAEAQDAFLNGVLTYIDRTVEVGKVTHTEPLEHTGTRIHLSNGLTVTTSLLLDHVAPGTSVRQSPADPTTGYVAYCVMGPPRIRCGLKTGT